MDNESIKQLTEQAQEILSQSAALSFMKSTEGWQILEQVFDDIEKKALDQLSEQRPGDTDNILAAHSVWYSVKHAFKNVRDAVDSAIMDGHSAKETLDHLNNMYDIESDSSI